MSENDGGWNIGDPQKFMNDYNKKALQQNFPPENRWEVIEGALVHDRPQVGDTLVSISGRDHKGEYAQMWVDIPNAMYLLAMLAQIQQETRADVPAQPPGNTKPHPSD